MYKINTTKSKSHFDRGAWLTLVLVVAFLLLCLAVLVYRFSLPMDGWLSAEPEGFDSYGLIYNQNIMGVPSDLQVGDHIIAVAGISLDNAEPLFSLSSLRSRWQAGNSVNYKVVRAGEVLEIAVPLVHWRWSNFIKNARVSLGFIFTLLSFVIFQGMGFIVFIRRPDIPAARALLVLGAGWLGVFFGIGPTSGYMISDSIFPVAGLSLVILITMAFTVLLPPAFIRFGLVFPRPKRMVERRPWIAYLPYVVGIIGVFAFAKGIFVFGYAWTAVSILVTILLLIHSAFSLQDAVSRAQMRWGLGGMLLGLGLFFSSYVPFFVDLPQPVTSFLNYYSVLGFGVMGVALGVAILRYRLFDIDVIIRRTLQYGLLTGLLGFVYFGSVLLGQRLTSALIGDPDSPLVLVVSTLLVAALFNPIRHRVQDFIDRRFYRRKYDALRTLAAFTETARDETRLEALVPALLGAVKDSLQPEQAWLWLKKPGRSA